MSSHYDIFPYFWLTIVTVIGTVSLVKGYYELSKGEARARWFFGYSEPMTRDEQPFYYWLIVLGDFAGVAVAAFMFWIGLDMFNW